MRYRVLAWLLLTSMAIVYGACNRRHDNDDFSPTAPGFTDALTLSPSSSSIPADGFSSISITARITASSPPKRRQVKFQTTDGQFIDPDNPAPAGDGKTKTADVDPQGAVTVELRSGTVPKIATITAKVLDATTTPPTEVAGLLTRLNVEFTPPDPGGLVKVGTSVDTGEADNVSQIFVHADIAPGSPAEARTVTFETTLGTFVKSNGPTVTEEADRNHRATVVLKSPSVAGRARITAKISGATAETFLQFVPALPDFILVRLDDTKLKRGQTEETMVTATLSRDPDRGMVTRNTVVTYSAFETASGRPLPLSFRNQTPSDEMGTAKAKVLLGSVAFVGTATIRAQVGGVTGEEDIDVDAPAPPEISVTPASLEFGEVAVGTGSEKSVALRNEGPSALTVQNLEIAGDGFTLEKTPPLPSVIAPAGTLLVTVKFTPAAEGARIGTLKITSNDPDEGSLTVTLTGTGK